MVPQKWIRIKSGTSRRFETFGRLSVLQFTRQEIGDSGVVLGVGFDFGDLEDGVAELTVGVEGTVARVFAYAFFSAGNPCIFMF